MKIFIATPTRGDPRMEFNVSLLLMVTDFICNKNFRNCQINPRVELGSILPSQRHNLAQEAIKWGADYILWIDDDMGFPKNTLERLINAASAGLDIVAANCPRKEIPPRWTAKRDGIIVNSNGKTGVEEVDSVGCAMMLVNMNVYKSLPIPHFELPWDPNAGGYVGEDVYFCRKAKKAGYKIFIDHDLSKEITHVGSYRYQCLPDELLEKALNMVEQS